MTVGDLVKKAQGANIGESGLVISIETNSADNTLVEVLSESGQIWTWPIQYVKIINKEEKNV